MAPRASPSPAAVTPAPAAPSPPTTARERAQVVSVIDGDTINVRIGATEFHVRYIGIDTPEVGRPYASEAKEANRRLVGGKTVELEKDVSKTDRFGRLLRYVYVETSAGTVMVNGELVRLGFAQVATFPPDVKYTQLFLELQQQARAAGAGLWASPSPTPSPSPRPTVAQTPAPTAAPVGHSVVFTFVSSPVSPGRTATASVRTTAGSSCSIVVTYKSGPSTAQGLYPKTADGSGNVSWSWTVGTRTTPGSWPIDVTCTSPSGARASQRAHFEVR